MTEVARLQLLKNNIYIFVKIESTHGFEPWTIIFVSHCSTIPAKLGCDDSVCYGFEVNNKISENVIILNADY